MCNGHNHSCGCACGFGGDGHLGRRSRSYHLRSPTRNQRYWGKKPLSTLAVELGRNITIPIICRNASCGLLIYLFANSNGGSAVFDHPLEPPWKKHSCGYGCDCHVTPLSGLDYDLPIPTDVKFNEYRSGAPLSGTVVMLTADEIGLRTRKHYQLTLYDGRALYNVRSTRRFPVGAYLKGTAQHVPRVGHCLMRVVFVKPPLRRRSR